MQWQRIDQTFAYHITPIIVNVKTLVLKEDITQIYVRYRAIRIIMPKDRVGDRRGIIYHHQCCVVVAISHISVAMRENCHLYCSSHGGVRFWLCWKQLLIDCACSCTTSSWSQGTPALYLYQCSLLLYFWSNTATTTLWCCSILCGQYKKVIVKKFILPGCSVAQELWRDKQKQL